MHERAENATVRLKGNTFVAFSRTHVRKQSLNRITVYSIKTKISNTFTNSKKTITLCYSCTDTVFILLFRIIRLQKNKLNLIVYRLQSPKLEENKKSKYSKSY